MNTYDVRRLALIEAVKAKIEGMKIDNCVAKINNMPPQFKKQDFEDKAAELENLAYVSDEQLF